MVKRYWSCSKCQNEFEEKDIAEIHFETQIMYRGFDAEVICKECSQKTGESKKEKLK